MLNVVDGPKSYPLNGRVAAIVLYLAKRADLINGHDKLKLELNCKGPDTQPRIEIFEERIQAPK